jgi:isoquinoline 1-oxidoreductase beta subunit
MSAALQPDRRAFLKVTAAAAGGLLIDVRLGPAGGAQRPAGRHALNVFVELAVDGTVTITAPAPEIGQGTRTALPMIVADEMEIPWASVRVVQAVADEKYGGMAVGGSDTVAEYWAPMREAGALARELLISAAAERWSVPRDQCRAEAGRVIHEPTGRSLSFGVLAEAAARAPRPDPIPLKDPAAFTLIGTPVPRVDLHEIVTGSAVFGYDVHVPGMRYAMVERCPVEGGTVRRFDASKALEVPGVEQIFLVAPQLIRGQRYGAVRGGVAVVADSFWAAQQGRNALIVEWNEGPNAALGSAQLRESYAALRDRPGATVIRSEGDPALAFREPARLVEAEYDLPILAHACMEPMSFTASVGKGSCETWGPTQNPLLLKRLLAEALTLPADKVTVHLTLEGGGFGRRLAYDYAMEAAAVSKQAGVPVKVVWTRPDDMHHDYFRTPSYHRMRAAIDAGGRLTAWRHHIVTSPLFTHILGPDVQYPEMYDVAGAGDFPYDVGHVLVEYSSIPVGLQLGSWRSVSHSFNVFAVNCFLDEIAVELKQDPLALHLALLGEPRQRQAKLRLPGRRGQPTWHTGRLAEALRLAAEKSGWGQPLPRGRGRGIACCFFKETVVAHVAEVSVDAAGHVKVDRIVAAVDCGRVVNPDGVSAQVEGAAIDGVATVLKWGITYSKGRVEQHTFADFPLVRIGEAPLIETHIIPSDAEPSGMGEPPYPSVAPAIVNAIFAASGRRVRRLPLEAP